MNDDIETVRNRLDSEESLAALDRLQDENERLREELESDALLRLTRGIPEMARLREENDRLRDKLKKWELNFPLGPGVSADKAQALVVENESLRRLNKEQADAAAELSEENERLLEDVANREAHHDNHHAENERLREALQGHHRDFLGEPGPSCKRCQALETREPGDPGPIGTVPAW